MDTGVIVAIITAIQVITVAVIGGIFNYFTKKAESKREAERQDDLKYRAEREEREAKRQERDKAIYGVVLTTAKGTELLLHHAHGEQLNGDVEKALLKMEGAIGHYNTIANENMAEL